MNKLTTPLQLIVVSILSLLSFTAAEAVQANGGPNFWNRHGTIGGIYCPHLHCCCFKNLATDYATPEQLLTGYGNIDVDISPTKQLHFVFHKDLDLAPDSLIPIDSATALDSAVAHALGYDGVTLVAGNYPVDYSTNPFGEATINAIFETHVSGGPIFWHRHAHQGGLYCVFPGCCCWRSLATDYATPEQLAAGYGNIDVDIPAPNKLHFVFRMDMELSPDSLIPIDTAVDLGSDVAHSLGWSGIVLVEGNYPVDFSTNQYGEATIDAIFQTFLSGDGNGDGSVDISDAVYLIAYIFAGGPAPNPLGSGDANCDLAVDISDAVYLIQYIFGGGPAPC